MSNTSFTKNMLIATVILELFTGGTGCKKQSTPDPVSAAALKISK
jgi:hypothetical protein